MILNLGKLFHRSSKDKRMRGAVNIPQDSSLWPESWRTITYKTYPRFPAIVLPAPRLDGNIEQAIRKRESSREWGSQPLSLQEISNLLFYSCGVTRKTADMQTWKRAQASGGARYPLEVYVINMIPGDLAKKVYHYNVRDHSLEALWDIDIENKDIEKTLYSYDWAHRAAAGIIITGVPERSGIKYGERAYRYMYYEAGGVAQTMQVIAETEGLGSIILGGTNDETIEQLLDVDGEQETLLLGVMIGHKKT